MSEPATKSTKIRSIEIKNFADFIDQTEVYDLLSDLVIFRGQPIKGNLLPKIARKNPKANTVEDEKKVLKQLRLQGASHVKKVKDMDLLVQAQHFGLATRLLDWTSNPLVALWFACADLTEGDAYVYGLEADKLLIEDALAQDPFKQAKTRVLQPPLSNARIIAQHGWFTLHRYSTATNEFVKLEKNSDARPYLTEFQILQKNRKSIVESLDRHGISYRTIFPDFEGVCRYLNWKHKLLAN